MKPFIKLDGWQWAVFMIASIFVPPLFIINMIIFLCQAIPRAIKNKQEQKEITEYNRISIQHEISLYQPYIINDSDKKIVDEKLSILKQSYLGKDAETIANFQFNLLNNNLIKKGVYDFVDFLIGLYESIPQEIRDLLPYGFDVNKIITDCIEILQNNLD